MNVDLFDTLQPCEIQPNLSLRTLTYFRPGDKRRPEIHLRSQANRGLR